MKIFSLKFKYNLLISVLSVGLFSYVLIANAVTTTCSTDLSSSGTYTLAASTTNTCNITSAGVVLDGGGFGIDNSQAIEGNGYSFDVSNINTTGIISSIGITSSTTINITNSNVATMDVSGADAAGDAQAGGIINLTNTTAGALIANGGDSTDNGYGGAAGSFSLSDSSSISQTANAGSCGPNNNNSDCPNIFTAQVDSDWDNTANWSKGTIPDSTSYVEIHSSISNVSSGNAYANSAIFIDASFSVYASFYISSDIIFTGNGHFEYGNLFVYGDQVSFEDNTYNAGYIEYFGNSTVNFYGNSYNYQTIDGNTNFYDNSYNYYGTLYGNTNFYDNSYNYYGYLYGESIFHGDIAYLYNGSVQNSLTRAYNTSVVSSRNFIDDYTYANNHAWIVTATSSIVVDLSNTTCDSNTTFVANGGTFIFGPNCIGVPAGISVVTPTTNATLASLSPVLVNWNQGVGGYNYSSCQYSFGNVANFSTSTSAWTDGTLWQGASCTGSGAEIRATSTYSGSQILAIRAFYNSIATSSIVNFTYTPSRFLYFYNTGSNSNWSTVGNWYTDASHTISAGSLPTSVDKITVIGSTTPTVDLDSWTQPALINSGQTGIVFTGASNASTTVTINGKASFNNHAKNKGRINGNVVFNDSSSNLSAGQVGNATLNASATNVGTIFVNGTFYGDISENTGTIYGIKTRYYNATTTTSRNFTNSWTVMADGVAVTIASSTQFNTTTKFKTANNGYFIGGPTAVYFWSSSNISNSWLSTSNWYSDSATTTALGYLPTATSTVITLGSVAPSVDLDSLNWITPTGIDASATGISFTSSAGASIDTGITGTTTFNGNAINLSTILGNVTFASTTKNNTGAVISGDVVFNTNSQNNGGLITGDVIFNNSSLNTNNSSIFGDVTFNSSSVNGTTTGSISGTATFYDTSRNDGVIDNNAVFYEDTANNNNTVSGTQTRYFTANATTTRNFVITGPWTLIANNAIVHLDDTSVFNATTTLTELNSGNFTGEGVPGSYTECTKPFVLPGTYTLETDTENICDIQVDGVTIDGGGNTIGNIPQAFPDNGANGWVDMTGNVLLMHMDETSGTLTDSSGNSNTGTSNNGIVSDTGVINGAQDLDNGNRISIAQSSSMNLTTTDRFTFSAWVKPRNSDGGAVFIQRNSCNNNYQYQFYLTYFVVQNQAAQNQLVQPNHQFIPDEWVHIATTYDGSDLKYYVNGNLDNTTNIGSININPNTSSSKIGHDTCSRDFDGLIDEAAIWNRALSLSDIQIIYNNQLPSIFITGNGYDFDINNATVGGSIISAGATINIANSTITTVDVSGVDAAGDGQAGGTINLINTTAGALIANGGDSTDYGYGGLAGTINLTDAPTSTATSETANAGANGPNLTSGQGNSGGSSSNVSGCTDPSASNYNPNATSDNGSCRYPTVQIHGCTNPSASNYNPNATINGSCSYPTYNPYIPTSSGGGNNGGTQGLGGTLGGIARVGSLIFNPLTPFGLNINNQLGFTYFGNILEGLNPVGNFNLKPITFSPNFSISSFLFDPLPKSITDALNRSVKLANVITSLGITKTQDLVSLTRRPIKLPASYDTPGLFIVSNGTTTLDNYLSNDLKKGLVQLVYVKSGDVLNVSLIPLSTGKVTGKFDGKDISFIQSPGKIVSSIITASTTPGKYFLTTQSAPLPLMIEVLSPPHPNPVKPPGFWARVMSWFSRLFH
jgi:hypothetical protein